MKNQKKLDNLVICPKCATLHKKVILKNAVKANCTVCHTTLYKNENNLLNRSLALSISTLVFFIIANLFPIVTINFQGNISDVTLSSVFIEMFERGYYLVGILCSFVIFILPLILLILFIALTIFMKLKIYENIVKKILVAIASLLPWNMMEIFLVSILIAMVKLIDYAEINFGISFWALVLFVIFDIYMSKNINIVAFWDLKERIYDKQKIKIY